MLGRLGSDGAFVAAPVAGLRASAAIHRVATATLCRKARAI